MKKNKSVREFQFIPLRKILMIMRLVMLLMLLGISQVHAGQVNSEAYNKISLKMKKSTIEQVLFKIEEKTNYVFIYNKNLINVNRLIDISVEGVSLDEVLSKVFSAQRVKFQRVDNNIIISPVYDSVVQQQQKFTITGKVIEKNGDPLAGVNVYDKDNPSKGVISSADGTYSVTINNPDAILVYSFIGFEPQEIHVAGRKVINITLLESSIALDEVVSIGYGTKKKTNLTGAVQQVTSKDIANRVLSNPVKSLQGAIPNLNITFSNGKPNAVPNINIRGVESLSGGNPLIIIDGIPSDIYQFMELNPNDIESVSTLMDAASAAIYGARAAFGVVLVTTKKAAGEKLNVSYNMNISFKNPIYKPDLLYDPYLVQQQRVLGAGGWYSLKNVWGNSDWNLLKQMSEDGTEVMQNPEDPTRYLYAGRTNWFDDAIKKNAMSQMHNVTISGKSDKVSYFLSGGYSRDNGVFNYSDEKYDKYNMRAKLDFELTKWLHLSNNSYYAYDTDDEPSQGINYNTLYNASTTDIAKNPDGSWTSTGASLFGSASEGGRSQSYNNRFSTSFTAKVFLIKDLLTLTGRASFMRNNWTNKSYWLPVEYKNGPDITGTYHPVADAQRKSWGERQNVYDIFADVDKTFNSHHFHVLIGYNQEYRYTEDFRAYRKDLISPSVPSIQLATGDREVGESVTDWSTRSGFFRFSYDYAGKYLVEFNGRYDGTSRFPKDDRFGFFPSVSVGWNIANEGFFDNISNIISSLKPRFSYGNLGNQDVGAYAYLPTMHSGKTRAIVTGNTHDQQTTLYAPGLVSGSLTWETVKTTNYGVDFGFLRNRLAGSFDYYHRNTLNMLTKSKQLPAVLGTSEPKENAADLITKGWELNVSWKDNFRLAGSQLNYNVGLNLADSRTWITRFDNPDGKLSDYYVGYEIGTIWGFVSNGLFQSEEELANHANQSSYWSYPGMVPPSPGDIKFEDLNGDGVIRAAQTVYDMQDQRNIGNSRPRYTTGIRASFDWKGIDFNMFWQGVLKKDWNPSWADSRMFWDLTSSPWTNLQKWNYENEWTPDKTDAYLPRVKGYAASWWGAPELIVSNTRYLQKVWYLRLRNVTLGYSLPDRWMSRVGIARLRVFVTGENLATFTGLMHPDIDPEVLNRTYPMQRIMAFGLSVNF